MEWSDDPNRYPPYLRTRIKQHRGVGSGVAYKPWLTVPEVPSKGSSTVTPGILIRRKYHLLSLLEVAYFYIRERDSDVVDIQEQWPILDISATEALCVKYGARHPNRGIYPEPITIDFVITRQSSSGKLYSAHSIKTKKDRDDPDVKRRLAVEYEWCSKNGIPWWVVDTSLFDPSKDSTVLDTLTFMRAWFLNRYTPIAEIKHYVSAFHEAYDSAITLNEITKIISRRLSISTQLSQDTFRYCAWYKIITVSLLHSLQLNMPVVLDGKDV
ncbi:TnsA endonuclease N-terminal domain-containing protein [Cupriavidus sp. UYPR2.512]|uniref:TnsA endonuclease N-terminal domain-containing protein n=1 Tax=Cupriavidus sp. UYPR2.512 TaxID=1080187 RepID=UPI0009D9C8FD|nr:TnsA endonuclease N-terminal domain-containing protein [Cupriavidus sp. UYPR2.512]UIF90068.1 Tn7 transposase TnsA N-terminal domain-containing protein [Cupriavidus necator]